MASQLWKILFIDLILKILFYCLNIYHFCNINIPKKINLINFWKLLLSNCCNIIHNHSQHQHELKIKFELNKYNQRVSFVLVTPTLHKLTLVDTRCHNVIRFMAQNVCKTLSIWYPTHNTIVHEFYYHILFLCALFMLMNNSLFLLISDRYLLLQCAALYLFWTKVYMPSGLTEIKFIHTHYLVSVIMTHFL